ncbi:hypothetical protein GOHSU_53_00130 [Gordonia hirsuta DSM 44140 = NBRC 16056]|uniref:Uncharacterized protein n=1 Tax=Gordonia hirsuta DSM 44140 = NBRC 16056 TaxID=1121927 RepID=L7LDH8_9ACTN|nr:hypothetical protein [Gordonia hirsuta]GAC58811.1 hypothetical protein GOHSU_53_00130 [Gordonia hirsuta DSM 44140 = NBRC 16056]
MNRDENDVVEEAIERRKVRDPEMVRRLRSELVRAGAAVHRRRLREWAVSDTGEFPSVAESQRIAVEEVEYLVRALGKYAGLEPDAVLGQARPRARIMFEEY